MTARTRAGETGRIDPGGEPPRAATGTGSVLVVGLWPALATVVLFAPEFLRDPAQAEETRWFTVVWLVAVLLAGPVTAYLVGQRRQVAPTASLAFVVGLPQLPVVLVLMSIDVWLDVQRGYLLAGSGEEAMSYGIATTLGAAAGLLLVVLVALAARVGTARRRRE
jgi:hypothetical protein